jgi:hypothetical protein
MEGTIYYPITILTLIILLNSSLVYYIVNLAGTDFLNITTGTCKVLPYYYIEVFIITGVYLISLISTCKCISIFRAIISVLYIIVFIGSTAFLYIKPDCMEMYKNTDNMKSFYYSIIFHYTVSLMIIMIILISYSISIVPKTKIPIYNRIIDEEEDDTLIVA